ncbi:ATP-binding protein [Amycolatopsis sp. NPDC023774]|uniref:sensor histidine kinase n=1 Tax=Amycolatopsis sp. NPDC023774 TaxID=3155015 RepID=UPI003404E5DC
MHAGEPARTPQPTLDELRALVEQSGRDVELDVTGDATDLPTGAALQAYRIVQEALTNMLKHAPPDASARVRVEFTRTEVLVEVTNTGGREPVAAGLTSSGRGLAGMAQRVELYCGKLETDPLPDGGFAYSRRCGRARRDDVGADLRRPGAGARRAADDRGQPAGPRRRR